MEKREMTVEELEVFLEKTEMLEVHVGDQIKRYIPGECVFNSDGRGPLYINTFGIYASEDGGYRFFIIDSERGLPEYSSVYEKEDDACRELIKVMSLYEQIYMEDYDDMTIKKLEKFLEKKGLLTVHFNKRLKRYISGDIVHSVNDSGSSYVDTYGIYKTEDDTYVFFVTDSERGIPEYSCEFELENSACKALAKTVSKQEYTYKMNYDAFE